MSETQAHREAVEEWRTYFEQVLNRPRLQMWSYIPIVWPCVKCGRYHKWNLEGFEHVVVNKQVPLLGRCRPDISLLDEAGMPLFVFEFRVTHFSETTRSAAKANSVPQFCIDVRRDSHTQTQLPAQVGLWSLVAATEGREPTADEVWADKANRATLDSAERSGNFSYGNFTVIPYSEGGIADVEFSAGGRGAGVFGSMPRSSIGSFLYASGSTLACASQLRWVAQS